MSGVHTGVLCVTQFNPVSLPLINLFSFNVNSQLLQYYTSLKYGLISLEDYDPECLRK